MGPHSICVCMCVHSDFMPPWASSVYLPIRFWKSMWKTAPLIWLTTINVSERRAHDCSPTPTHRWATVIYSNTHIQTKLPTRKGLYVGCRSGCCLWRALLCDIWHKHGNMSLQTEKLCVVWPWACFAHVSCGYKNMCELCYWGCCNLPTIFSI